MAKYPIYLNLVGRRTVVVGGGTVALRKVQALVEAESRVTVVAEHIMPTLEDAFAMLNVEIVLSPYSKDYLVGATLCIAATNDPTVNKKVYADCQELEILCNVVDEPELCDFFVPAVVKRGDLQIAISTDGNCPAYAGHIRKKLEEMFTETHAQFVKELEKLRNRIIAEIPTPDQRKILLGQLVSDESFDYFAAHGPQKWHEHYHLAIENAF
jgi:precorrin-2 dehydrogenase/sirohydrochlorin ferrochelatase